MMPANIFVTESQAAAIFEILGDTEENFVRLCKKYNARPSEDFCNADLRGADFTDCDLSGFNFEGADLRGAHGTNVRYDETTSFKGADLGGSCFAARSNIEAYFLKDPAAQKLYARFIAHGPMDLSLWAMRTATTSPDEAFLNIIRRLYIERDSSFLRTNLLYAMRGTRVANEGERDFILYLLSRPDSTEAVILPAIRFLGTFYASDPMVSHILIRFAIHGSQAIRLAAIEGTLNSPRTWTAVELLAPIVTQDSSVYVRRQFVKLVGERMGEAYHFAFADFERTNKSGARAAGATIGYTELRESVSAYISFLYTRTRMVDARPGAFFSERDPAFNEVLFCLNRAARAGLFRLENRVSELAREASLLRRV